MAAIPCDLCGEEEAVMLQTATANGDTLGVGAACIIGFYLGCLGTLTEGIPHDAAKAYTEPLATIIGHISPSMLDLAASAKRRPRGKTATAPAMPTETAEATHDTATSPDGDAQVTGSQPE